MIQYYIVYLYFLLQTTVMDWCMYGRPELSCSPLPEYHGAFHFLSLGLCLRPRFRSKIKCTQTVGTPALMLETKALSTRLRAILATRGDLFFCFFWTAWRCENLLAIAYLKHTRNGERKKKLCSVPEKVPQTFWKIIMNRNSMAGSIVKAPESYDTIVLSNCGSDLDGGNSDALQALIVW